MIRVKGRLIRVTTKTLSTPLESELSLFGESIHQREKCRKSKSVRDVHPTVEDVQGLHDEHFNM